MAEQGFIYLDDKALQRSVDNVVKELRRVTGRYLSGEAVKKVHYENSYIFQNEMARLAQKGTEPHYIKYAGNKSRRKLMPGNLKRSITVFPAKDKDSTVVYIGPRRKGAKHGDKRADGFYGYFLAYGTSKGIKGDDFINKAYSNKKRTVINYILKDLEDQVKLANKDFNRFSKSV